MYGLSSNVNVGFDLWFKSVHVRNEPGASAIEFLRKPGEMSDLAITGIGPKIKVAPFKKVQRLSIQSTFLFPLRKDLENRNRMRPFLEFDRNTLWITQFFYDKPLGTDFQLFFQVAPWVTFVRESFRENNFIQTPASVFFSWFPTSRLTLYAQSEYWPTHYDNSAQSFSAFYSWFVQSGAGLKYQLIPGFLEVEGLYTNFWLGSDGEGAGQTFNIGFRIIN